MDTKSLSLNDKLAHASKKFYKSCEQIKLIKQRISELINVFTYCDQEMMTMSPHRSHQHQQHSHNQQPTRVDENNNYLIRNEHNYMNLSNLQSDISQAASQQQQQQITNEQLRLNSEQRNSHLNIFKESLRQQIENLQCIKTAYFMYAHRKADEITKLQCELYGEDAVREAYERAEPDVLLPVSNSTNVNNSGENASLDHAMDAFITSNDFEMNVAINSPSDSNSWTPWSFNRYTSGGNFSSLISTSQQDNSSSSTSSSQQDSHFDT